MCKLNFSSKGSSNERSLIVFGNKGASLVELLLATGMSVALAFAIISVTNMQVKNLRLIYQQIQVAEFRNNLVQSMKGRSYSMCSSALKDQIVDTTSVTPLNASTTSINIPVLTDSNNVILAQADTSSVVNSILPGSDPTSGLVVSKITFDRIVATGNPNEYKGTLEIDFDPTYLAGPVKPVQIEQIFKTNPAAGSASQPILGCGTACPPDTIATDFSCVDMAPIPFSAAGATYGDVDAYRRGAIEACLARGKRVADTQDMAIACMPSSVPPYSPAFSGVASNGSSIVNYWIDSGNDTLASGNACNLILGQTVTNTAITYVLCAFTKKTHSC
jgi:hypothetical protein